MTNLLPTAVSAIFQICLFLLIPFIWWLVTARKQKSFLPWLGWIRPRIDRPVLLGLIIVGTVAIYTALGQVFIPLLNATDAKSPLTGLGWAGLGAALIYALVQTAFTEESLFRGFILRRLATRFGFWIANVAQAVLFGLAHMLPLAAMGMSLLPAAGTAIYSGSLGLLMGWLNERMGGASLVPGWILHALANLVSAYFTLFLIN